MAIRVEQDRHRKEKSEARSCIINHIQSQTDECKMSIEEDTQRYSSVSDVFSNSVSDVDIGASEGIAVTGVTGANGTWYYSLDEVTWVAMTDAGLLSDGSVLLLRSSDYLYYSPNEKP